MFFVNNTNNPIIHFFAHVKIVVPPNTVIPIFPEYKKIKKVVYWEDRVKLLPFYRDTIENTNLTDFINNDVDCVLEDDNNEQQEEYIHTVNFEEIESVVFPETEEYETVIDEEENDNSEEEVENGDIEENEINKNDLKEVKTTRNNKSKNKKGKSKSKR